MDPCDFTESGRFKYCSDNRLNLGKRTRDNQALEKGQKRSGHAERTVTHMNHRRFQDPLVVPSFFKYPCTRQHTHTHTYTRTHTHVGGAA